MPASHEEDAVTWSPTYSDDNVEDSPEEDMSTLPKSSLPYSPLPPVAARDNSGKLWSFHRNFESPINDLIKLNYMAISFGPASITNVAHLRTLRPHVDNEDVLRL
jgi:hypothetical protein